MITRIWEDCGRVNSSVQSKIVSKQNLVSLLYESIEDISLLTSKLSLLNLNHPQHPKRVTFNTNKQIQHYAKLSFNLHIKTNP